MPIFFGHPFDVATGKFHHGLVYRVADTIDQCVDMAELPQHLLGYPVHVGRLGGVTRQRERGASQSPDFLGYLIHTGLGQSGDGYIGARLGEHHRDALADSPACSNQQYLLSGYVKFWNTHIVGVTSFTQISG